MIETDLYYTQDHEWVRMEGQSATVGITYHAQEQLGEITFLELPPVGQTVAGHQEIGMIESSKAASDIYSPVAGEIVEVNQQLEDQPELINRDCYQQGWICKIQTSADNPTEHLMNAKEYDQYLKGL
jgi:glycine cleavage system H protein